MNTFPSTCPACAAPTTHGDRICVACGLVFASHAAGNNAPLAGSMPIAPPVFVPVLPRPGQVLARGRYVVQRILSKGGMGALFLATDREAFDRLVVVKALLDYFDARDPQQVSEAHAQFLQEAKTLAALRHPAIPLIFTYFFDATQHYLVMEYVEGANLEQHLTHTDDVGVLLPGRPYARDDVLRWGRALCGVLEYLASRQPHPVVHHDLKPANLILEANIGDVRLVDFGTARSGLLMQSGTSQPSTFGTPGYAPPEQYQGRSEARSDVYALAATLYHLATDDDPRNHSFSFPQLAALGSLGQVLTAALATDVTQRPTATELRGQFEALLQPGAPLEAPNGDELADLAAIVTWCEGHWEEACDWLHSNLPDVLEVRWGQGKLARDLRQIVKQHRHDVHLALDAALAAMDPHGFGAVIPQVDANKATIDFGVLAPTDYVTHDMILSNVGRRVVHARFHTPAWISGTTDVVLPPRRSKTIRVTASRAYALVSRQLGYSIVLAAGATRLLDVPVHAHISPWHDLRQQLRAPALALLVIVIITSIIVHQIGWFRLSRNNTLNTMPMATSMPFVSVPIQGYPASGYPAPSQNYAPSSNTYPALNGCCAPP